jgi:hypothetical protein
VRFSGDLSKEAAKALRAERMGRQRRDSFFDEPLPYSTTVVVRADGPEDAVARVRQTLEGLGEFVGYEATAFTRRREEQDDD